MSVPALDEVLGRRSVRVAVDHHTAAVFAPIAEELLEMVELLEGKGLAYAREYLEHVRAGGHGQPPGPPLGMHRRVSAAIRDVVLDHVQNARFTAGRRSA